MYMEKLLAIFIGFHQTNFSFLTAHSLQKFFYSSQPTIDFFHGYSPTKQTLRSARMSLRNVTIVSIFIIFILYITQMHMSSIS
jgi:hypothetical protein